MGEVPLDSNCGYPRELSQLILHCCKFILFRNVQTVQPTQASRGTIREEGEKAGYIDRQMDVVPAVHKVKDAQPKKKYKSIALLEPFSPNLDLLFSLPN
jgi:hypothetical protein